METEVKRLYEGLFLVDSGEAASDWAGVNDAIKRILDRNGAEITSLAKWDERKLAYEVDGKARGTYMLVYFNGEPERVNGIERDVQLSEQIMRVMILRTDKMSTEDIEKLTPAGKVEAEQAAAQAREAEAEAVKGQDTAETPDQAPETTVMVEESAKTVAEPDEATSEPESAESAEAAEEEVAKPEKVDE